MTPWSAALVAELVVVIVIILGASVILNARAIVEALQ